jgi:hypothetical protein
VSPLFFLLGCCFAAMPSEGPRPMTRAYLCIQIIRQPHASSAIDAKASRKHLESISSTSPVSRLPSPVSRLPSPVSRLPSPVSRLPSPVSKNDGSIPRFEAAFFPLAQPDKACFRTGLGLHPGWPSYSFPLGRKRTLGFLARQLRVTAPTLLCTLKPWTDRLGPIGMRRMCLIRQFAGLDCDIPAHGGCAR